MPIHDVGYRSWTGQLTPQLSRWWIIAVTGIRLALKSRWVKRILFVAWLPVMYWGIGFYFVEKAIEADQNIVQEVTPGFEAGLPKTPDTEAVRSLTRQTLARQIRSRFAIFPKSDQLADSLQSDDEGALRNTVWRWLLMVFFRYPQAILILFLIGSVAPALIARDMRSRAFLLYFSRPIGKLEYIVGKLAVPAAFITAVTTLPALALYVFAVLMSPDISVLWNTWDIPIRIILATFALVIPTSAIALMLSSLTQESRFASFSWFAVWALGHGAWLAIVTSTSMRLQLPPVHADVMNHPSVSQWSFLSIYNCLGDVQAWIFGFESFSDIAISFFVMVGIIVASLLILYRRVSAPIRI